MPTNLINREHYATGVHIRENADGSPSRTVEGYAVVFNQPSQPLYAYSDEEGREIIDPAAITREILDASDIKLTMFHDRQMILGRSRQGVGTLVYEIDGHGVKFRCDVAKTVDGDKALELVSRGDIAGCSFAFACAYGDRECVAVDVKKEDGVRKVTYRVMHIAEIFDFTLAADPAYPQTSVDLREISHDAVPDNTDSPDEPDQTDTPDNNDDNDNNSQTNNNNNQMPKPILPDAPRPAQERTAPTLTQIIRERLEANSHGRFELVIQREGEPEPTTPVTPTTDPDNTVVTDVPEAGRVVPTTIQDIIGPVGSALIYQQIGIPVSHSLRGEIVWPTYAGGELKIVGENEAIMPAALSMDKMTMRPERFSARFDASYESIYQSNNVVEKLIRQALNEVIAQGLNKLLLSTSKLEGAALIEGPLVAAASKATTISTVNFKNINKIKASFLGKGKIYSPVWVMNPSTYCELEATPKDSGSGVMIIENNKMCGYPVFVSDAVDESLIALGDWTYQPAGFFGEMRLIVDPYTSAEKNVIRFILNFGFGTKTLRPEVFVAAKIS